MQSPSDNRQRDHLANIRTLLAWVRTAITMMAFGLVIAKFGLLLEELPGHHHTVGHTFAAVAGTVVVLTAVAFLVAAAVEFRAVRNAIETGRIRFEPGLYLWLSAVLVGLGVVLSAYILISS